MRKSRLPRRPLACARPMPLANMMSQAENPKITTRCSRKRVGRPWLQQHHRDQSIRAITTTSHIPTCWRQRRTLLRPAKPFLPSELYTSDELQLRASASFFLHIWTRCIAVRCIAVRCIVCALLWLRLEQYYKFCTTCADDILVRTVWANKRSEQCLCERIHLRAEYTGCQLIQLRIDSVAAKWSKRSNCHTLQLRTKHFAVDSCSELPSSSDDLSVWPK
jgi:hypothetical protein